MGKLSDHLTQFHKDFIAEQKMFFVATAPKKGKINISPKGINSIEVVDDKTLVWLNLTGSGNETAAHLLEDNRITIMMNAFEGNPMILRIYGTAESIHQHDQEWSSYINLFPPSNGARNIIKVKIESVMSSCGFGVPIMEYKEERTELTNWAEKKGPDGIKAYQKEKNVISLDGKPTELFEKD